MVFSRCEIGFPSGNSKVPAKSCPVYHLGLVCSYAKQNIPSFLLPSSSQCYTGVWFFGFCFVLALPFLFVLLGSCLVLCLLVFSEI